MPTTKLLKFAEQRGNAFQIAIAQIMVDVEKNILAILDQAYVGGSQRWEASIFLNSLPQMLRELEAAGYGKLVEEYVGEYEKLVPLVKEAFSARLLPDPKFTAADAELFRSLAEVDLSALDKIGETALTTLRDGLYKSALYKEDFNQLVNLVRETTTGVDKRGGSLARYAYTHVNTAMLEFTGAVLFNASESIGAEKFEVVGPLDGVTREKCRTALRKKIGTMAEWRKMGYTGGAPGGWNCRHQHFPFFGTEQEEIEIRTKARKRLNQFEKKQVKKTARKAAAVKEPTRTIGFVPAKSIDEANKWAVDNNLAKVANYKGLGLEAANTLNERLHLHFSTFPELRGKFDFIGSIQNRNRNYVKNNLDETMELYYGHLTDKERARKLTTKLLKRRAGKAGSNTWAVASYYRGMKGISFNEKFFKPSAITATKESFFENVTNKWHPEGTASLQALVDHEIGHQVDRLYSLRDSGKELNRLFNKLTPAEVESGLSRYACTNNAEFIAEGWAEYLNNPKPRLLARQIGAVFEQVGAKK